MFPTIVILKIFCCVALLYFIKSIHLFLNRKVFAKNAKALRTYIHLAPLRLNYFIIRLILFAFSINSCKYS
jgi:hypothetical protein